MTNIKQIIVFQFEQEINKYCEIKRNKIEYL